VDEWKKGWSSAWFLSFFEWMTDVASTASGIKFDTNEERVPLCHDYPNDGDLRRFALDEPSSYSLS
jgi:hypothetical protein